MTTMFPKSTYIERRKVLKEKLGKGLVLFFGNNESPMNYTDNTYHLWGRNPKSVKERNNAELKLQ